METMLNTNQNYKTLITNIIVPGTPTTIKKYISKHNIIYDLPKLSGEKHLTDIHISRQH